MNELDTIGRDLAERYIGAVQTADLSTFGELFAEDVRIFDTWGPKWSYENRAAWLQFIAAWFDSRGEETVRVSFEDLRVSGAQKVGVLTAIVTFKALSKAGQELRSLQNRLTWTFEDRGTSWLITHEHTSAPIQHEGLKALLKRSSS